MFRASPILNGVVIAAMTATVIELTALAVGPLDSPPPILVLAVVIAAYRGARRSGLACASVLLAYVLARWHLPAGGLDYTNQMALRLGFLAVSLPLTAVLVGFLKNRADTRFEAALRSESEIRGLHGELKHALSSRERLLSMSMDMICTANAAGQFTMVSAACERIFGYKPAEMEGRKFMDFVHPDDHERTTAIAIKIISGLSTAAFINRYIRKDGSYVHVMWSSRWVVEDQLMYAVARDYSEQKAVDDERSRFVAIIEATTDLVGISWSDGRVSFINKAGRALMGIGPDEDVSQLMVHDLYTEWAAELLVGHATNTALNHGIWSGETELHPRGRAPLPVSQIVLSHRDATGKVEFMSTIARDISTIKALEARLRVDASTDELTGLFNRRQFMERFHAALASANRRGYPLSFAICDLDGFKQINDLHGHVFGDKVLQEVGLVLSEEVRGEDLVGRYGGDEFCLMFPHVPAARAAVCLERIRNHVSALRFASGGTPVSLTMTFGIADLGTANTSAPTLIEAADKALYRAKSAGRNCIEVEMPIFPV